MKKAQGGWIGFGLCAHAPTFAWCVYLFLCVLFLTAGKVGAHSECDLDYAGTSVQFTNKNGLLVCGEAYDPESKCAEECYLCALRCTTANPDNGGTFKVDGSGEVSCDCHKSSGVAARPGHEFLVVVVVFVVVNFVCAL